MVNYLDEIVDELSSLADLGVKKSKLKGVEGSEVFISNIDSLDISIRSGVVEARQGISLGIGIRVVHNGKVGFAATSGVNESKIDKVIEEAIQVAKIRPLDPKFKHLPDPISISSKDGIIDENVLDFSEKEALEEVKMLADEAFAYDKRVKALFGGVGVQKGVYAVANSRGVSEHSIGVGIGGGVYLTAVENGKQKTGVEAIDSRTAVQFSGVGVKAAERAIGMLDSQPLKKSFRTTIVWENLSIAPLLKGMIGAASSARNVQEGKSYFKGKLGEKVASKNLSVIDDGQLPEGLSTFKIDTEGTPSQITPLIDSGFLKNHIFDSYSAYQEDQESTGNAGRGWPEPFLSTPNVSTSNIVLNTGKRDLTGLIGQVDEGILVTSFVMGVGHSNMLTGEFSVVAPSAFLLNNGEIKHPLESITIAGNFFQSLKSIIDVGSDVRITSVGKTPSLTIEDLTVSG